MKTTRKTDYAVHALMILAKNKKEELSVKELADLENVFQCVAEIHGCKIKDRFKIHRVFAQAYQKMLAELEQTTINDIIEPEIR